MQISALRRAMSAAATEGPLTSRVRTKLAAALTPHHFVIHNDSHKHAGHAAMEHNTSTETHFRLEIVSEQFAGKSLVQRHRTVYGLLDDEIRDGIHALQLTTKTPEEWAKQPQK